MYKQLKDTSCKRDRVGGLVKNGHFLRDVFMQWPLIIYSFICRHNADTMEVTNYKHVTMSAAAL